jgi:hypothetical protein
MAVQASSQADIGRHLLTITLFFDQLSMPAGKPLGDHWYNARTEHRLELQLKSSPALSSYS